MPLWHLLTLYLFVVFFVYGSFLFLVSVTPGSLFRTMWPVPTACVFMVCRPLSSGECVLFPLQAP